MKDVTHQFEVTLAQGKAEITAAQRLRYSVFVEELGASGPMVDHANQLECDRFDSHATHFLLHDRCRATNDQVVGVYRVMTAQDAHATGQYYCEDEYDLDPLKKNGGKLLELGRSCLHPDYRGGSGLLYLWSAIAKFVQMHEIETLFGVASFHGVDVDALSAPLSLLHAQHLAPKHLRVTAKPAGAQPMPLIEPEKINRIAARRDTPALIKAYLRLGGMVGDGAFIDRDFNTTDICLILPTSAVNNMPRHFETGSPCNV